MTGDRYAESWDEIITGCDSIDGLSSDEIRDAKDAYRFIEGVFGQSFLFYEHPFAWQVCNRASWTRKWIVEFAGIVKRTSQLSNFGEIRRKLKDPQQYGEGKDLMRLADALTARGATVEFEPKLNHFYPTLTSVPDLGVVYGEERFYIEHSDLRLSDNLIEADEEWHEFNMVVMENGFGLLHAGRLFKRLSSRHRQEILEKLSLAAETARKENRLCEVLVEGAIAFAFAPDEKRPDLEEWGKTYGHQVNTASGPALSFDLISRVKRKIGDKQKQLPADRPNVIVITSSDNFIFEGQALNVINEIEEKVYEHPHVGLLLLRTPWGGSGTIGTFAVGGHQLSIRPGMINQSCAIVFSNRFSDFAFSAETKALLQQVFGEF